MRTRARTKLCKYKGRNKDKEITENPEMGVRGERRRWGAHGPAKEACGDKYERGN